jgi:hypothetical protein
VIGKFFGLERAASIVPHLKNQAFEEEVEALNCTNTLLQ